MSYRFHVDDKTGDLVSNHFGGPVTEDPLIPGTTPQHGWSTMSSLRREIPTLGKGDFRTPAVLIRHADESTVSDFKYQSHSVIDGKPDLQHLPGPFGTGDEVSTLIVHMYDHHSHIAADLTYSVFPEQDAIVRSVNITNKGQGSVTVENLASLNVDLPSSEYDIIGLRGEWTRERSPFRRRVDFGTQR